MPLLDCQVTLVRVMGDSNGAFGRNSCKIDLFSPIHRSDSCPERRIRPMVLLTNKSNPRKTVCPNAVRCRSKGLSKGLQASALTR